MDTISFDLRFVPCLDDETGAAYLFAEVVMRINGDTIQEVDSGLVFDANALLVCKDADSEFDLFTCSCGVAGCAGINESIEQRVVDGVVIWAWPKDLAGDLNIDVTKPLVFDLAQYRAAIDALEASLFAKDAEVREPVVLDVTGHFSLPDKPLADRLEASRKWYWDCRAEALWQVKVFGDYRDCMLVTRGGDGVCKGAHVLFYVQDALDENVAAIENTMALAGQQPSTLLDVFLLLSAESRGRLMFDCDDVPKIGVGGWALVFDYPARRVVEITKG